MQQRVEVIAKFVSTGKVVRKVASEENATYVGVPTPAFHLSPCGS